MGTQEQLRELMLRLWRPTLVELADVALVKWLTMAGAVAMIIIAACYIAGLARNHSDEHESPPT